MMAAMKRLRYEVPVFHIDETRMQVIKEAGRENYTIIRVCIWEWSASQVSDLVTVSRQPPW
jgi:hypothetical protein